MAAAFCGSCGTKLAGAFCSICGSAVGQAHQQSTGATTTQTNTPARSRSFFDSVFKPRPTGPDNWYSPDPVEQAPGNSISPELVRRWSWGGFLLPVLWPFWHGMEALGIVMVICLLPFLWPVGLGIAIYLGLKGNQLAVQGRVYGTDQEFLKVEKAWAMWGIIGVIVGVIMNILWLFMATLSAILSAGR